MKKISIFLVSIFLALSIVGCSEYKEKEFLKGGRFIGQAEGYEAELTAEVNIKNGTIIDIKISGNTSEKEEVLEAINTMPDKMIANQSLAVDGISGATVTSEAIIKAVEDALEKSGADLTYFKESEEALVGKKFLENHTYDTVIIGSGAAGLTAAVEAASRDKSVLVIEKLPFPGGNTALSGGEIAVPNNRVQENQGIEDSPEKMIEDMYYGSYETADMNLVEGLAKNMSHVVTWLEEYCGVEFYDKVYRVQGHSVARTIMPKGQGKGLISSLVKKAEELGADFIYNSKAISLLTEGERIAGVKVVHDNHIYDIYGGDRIVLATGGFSSNAAMIEKHNTHWSGIDEHIPTSNAPGITGDGLKMAEAVGAKLIDMNYIQLYPYNNPASGMHYYMDTARMLNGAFIINKQGKRFVNENEVRDKVAGEILKQTSKISYEVFNEEIMKVLENDMVAMEEIERCFQQGVLVKADTIEECAEYFGIDSKEARKTLDQYNSYIENGYDEEFGRNLNFKSLKEGPYYILSGVPSVHHTMGGVKINSNAQVENLSGEVIEGLYAAGEVTGGIHGKNRLGSCAVADALYFGRVAGGYGDKSM